jgi:hypothetical protein
MANLTDLLVDVRAALSQAPDIVIKRALNRAATYLLTQSQFWMAKLDAIPLENGVDRYDFGSDSGTRVLRIVSINIDGASVNPPYRPKARIMDLLTLPPTTGMPRAFALDPVSNELVVWPTPTSVEAGHNLNVTAVLTLKRGAYTLPDAIIDEYGPGFVAYAKADLFALSPNTPWHDLKEAMTQRQIGDEYMARARQNVTSGNFAADTVQQRPFA